MRQLKLVSFVILCTLLLVPTIAFAQEPKGNVGYGVTTAGRLWATIDAVVGLISASLAGLSLFRSAGRFGTGTGRRGAIVAAVVGLIVIAYAVLHLTIFTGGFGTGSGRAGAIVAIVMGLTTMVLAGITLTRSRLPTNVKGDTHEDHCRDTR
jgi:Family of unknown function (DUF6223)